MVQLGSNLIDVSSLWTFILLLTRFAGVMFTLPGIGTERVPENFQFWAAATMAFALFASGVEAPEPNNILELMTMLGSELILGVLIGSVPMFVLSGLAVAGQVIAGAIGLGQANQIDRSLGTSVSDIALIEMLIATVIFLVMNGHHAVIRAASGIPGEAALGLFRPDMDTVRILTERLSASFELAVVVSAPVLVTALVTQFVLGLITKFIPQVNIFIISLPLTLIIGLYLVMFSLPTLSTHVYREFTLTEEIIGELFPVLQSDTGIPGDRNSSP